MSILSKKNIKYFLFLVLFIFFFCPQAFALDPEEVLVIANLNAAKSKGLARYYMGKRHIPEKNLVLLFMTDKETCTRDEYTKKAILPIRKFLDRLLPNQIVQNFPHGLNI